MDRKILFEVCTNGLQSALNAQEAGADRIELCEHLEVGGLTPHIELIIAAREKLSIPIRHQGQAKGELVLGRDVSNYIAISFERARFESSLTAKPS